MTPLFPTPVPIRAATLLAADPALPDDGRCLSCLTDDAEPQRRPDAHRCLMLGDVRAQWSEAWR